MEVSFTRARAIHTALFIIGQIDSCCSWTFYIYIGAEYNETTITGRTRTWLSDRYYSDGSVAFTDPNLVISDTNHPQIYRSERYGQFQYEIPIPVGNYEIILHFAET